MFENKKNSLYKKAQVKSVKNLNTMNVLERAKFIEDRTTYSGNGAVKLDTTGNIFTDDFASISRYKALRTPQEIFETVDAEYALDPEMTLRMAAYIRAITRDTKVGEDKTKVIGQGLRHEYFFRLLRLASKDLRNFEENFPELIALGSKKDIFDLWRIQLEYGETIIPEKIFLLIITMYLGVDLHGAVGPDNLLLKYLPSIRSKNGQKTMRFEMNSYIGRKISDYLWPELPVEMRRKAYRQLKSSGSAHEWQKKISQCKFGEIDWKKVSGKALTVLTRSKFLKNHNLEDVFSKWLKKQDTVKSTSYVFDLVCPSLDNIQQELANKQFMDHVNKTGECRCSLLTAVDVSGSMGSKAIGTNYLSIQIAYAMAAFFGHTLKGRFQNNYVTFSNEAELRKFEENETPYDCVHNHKCEWDFGSTDFLNVVDIICNARKSDSETSETEFPSGILCVSDGEFNSCGNTSNFTEAKKRLRQAGFSEEYVKNFQVVLWDIPNSYYGRTKPVFECLVDTPNFFHMSGLDPAGIAFLTSGEYIPPKTTEELMETALNQELFKMLKVY